MTLWRFLPALPFALWAFGDQLTVAGKHFKKSGDAGLRFQEPKQHNWSNVRWEAATAGSTFANKLIRVLVWNEAEDTVYTPQTHKCTVDLHDCTFQHSRDDMSLWHRSALTYFFSIGIQFTTHSLHNCTCLKLIFYSPTQIETNTISDLSLSVWHAAWGIFRFLLLHSRFVLEIELLL